MASLSLKLNEETPTNRSDPSTMYNIDQISLARLRPEKFDDAAIKSQILLIQEVCEDVSLDVIAVVFHECDYNMQNTIARIKAGDFEDSEWQTAKSSNKKKNNNQVEQTANGGSAGGPSDSEKSPSQHMSPTSSHRDNDRRKRQQNNYEYSSVRSNTGRRGNDPSRNQPVASFNSRNNLPNNQSLSKVGNSSEITSVQNTNQPPPLTSHIEEFEFMDGNAQPSTFNTDPKKTSASSSIKRPIPSAIPQVPVSMHRILNYPGEPLDIQFGDIQWNDSVPIAVSPSNSSIVNQLLDNDNAPPSSHTDQDENSNNIPVAETTTQLSSLSLMNNNPSDVCLEETSHLSDSLHPDALLQTTTSSASLAQTSTSNAFEFDSSTGQVNANPFIPQSFQTSLSTATNISSGENQSAFTPYTTAPGTYTPMPRDYSHTGSAWIPPSPNCKVPSKTAVIQSNTYQQQPSYPMQHQQYFVPSYGYSQTIYPYMPPVDSWSTAGLDPYTGYSTANYVPAYTTQQIFHPTTTVQSNKYDRASSDKDFFANYGQTRLSTSELSKASQTSKDTITTSKLSANAASFSQGASLTPTSPAALYVNSVLYPFPPLYTSQHDRSVTYSSVDTRDNRLGASYAGNHHNRNHYHHYHHQRSHTNNSMWHSQQ